MDSQPQLPKPQNLPPQTSQPPRVPSIELIKQFKALPGGAKVLHLGASLAFTIFGAVAVNFYHGFRSYQDLDNKIERCNTENQKQFEEIQKQFKEIRAQATASEKRILQTMHMMWHKEQVEKDKK